MTASKIGSKYTAASRTVTHNSAGAVSMSATPRGYADFVNKIGEKLYTADDCLGNEPNHTVNPQST